jgi:hypothetical protein
MGKFQKFFRWLNESAYLVSVPFIMCILLGLAIQSHWLLVVGATVVVLLNIGRILAGLANLVVIPFRDSPLQGILFLIPPITFYYLWKNWPRVHRPVRRIAVPIATLGLVLLAFVAEAWLEGRARSRASVDDSLQPGARSMDAGLSGKANGAAKPDVDGLGDLLPKASEALRSLESGGPGGSRPRGPR